MNCCIFVRYHTLITEVFPVMRKMERKEEIVSKSYWVCAISRQGVWTSHTGQTGCAAGFNPSRHSRAWTVCISAGQNGARLIEWLEKRMGSSLVLKLYWVMLNRILTRYIQRFFFSLHFSRTRENLCYQGGGINFTHSLSLMQNNRKKTNQLYKQERSNWWEVRISAAVFADIRGLVVCRLPITVCGHAPHSFIALFVL